MSLPSIILAHKIVKTLDLFLAFEVPFLAHLDSFVNTVSHLSKPLNQIICECVCISMGLDWFECLGKTKADEQMFVCVRHT